MLLRPLWFGNVRIKNAPLEVMKAVDEQNICERFPGGQDFHDYYHRSYHYRYYDPTKSMAKNI